MLHRWWCHICTEISATGTALWHLPRHRLWCCTCYYHQIKTRAHTLTLSALLDAFVLPVTPPVLHIRLAAELQWLPWPHPHLLPRAGDNLQTCGQYGEGQECQAHQECPHGLWQPRAGRVMSAQPVWNLLKMVKINQLVVSYNQLVEASNQLDVGYNQLVVRSETKVSISQKKNILKIQGCYRGL